MIEILNFNWISEQGLNAELHKSYIELEYELRLKIMKFLISRLEHKCEGDFSSFHFDVDMVSRTISISEKTPRKYAQEIEPDFDTVINSNCC